MFKICQKELQSRVNDLNTFFGAVSMKCYRKKEKREREKGVKLSYKLQNPDETYTFQFNILIFKILESILS